MKVTDVNNIITKETNSLVKQILGKTSLTSYGIVSDVSWFDISFKLMSLESLRKITIFVQEDLNNVIDINYLLFHINIPYLKQMIPNNNCSKRFDIQPSSPSEEPTEYIKLENWEKSDDDTSDYIEIDNWDETNI